MYMYVKLESTLATLQGDLTTWASGLWIHNWKGIETKTAIRFGVACQPLEWQNHGQS